MSSAAPRRDPFWAHRRSFLTTFLAAILLSLALSSSVFAAPSGETLHWDLNEGSGSVATDGSGNGIDGSIINAGWGAGAIGGGLDATGGSFERVTAVDTALDLGADGEITVSFWMNSTTIPSGGDFAALVRRRNTSGMPQGYGFYLTGSPSTLVFDLNYGGGVASLSTGASGLLDGDWHHIVGVIDNTSIELYVDGVSRGTTAKTAFTSSTSEPFVVGSNADANNAAFDYDGLIDEVYVYPTALDVANVNDLFDDFAPSPLVVNSTAVTRDALPGDGNCNTGATNVDGDPECTLHAAIEETNAGAADTIHFSIPTADPGYTGSWWTIRPTVASGSFDAITSAVELDGTTQPGWVDVPIIVLDAANAPAGTDGLAVASTMAIRGLAVVNAPDDGIDVTGDDVVVDAVFSGVLPDGVAAGNLDEGIDVQTGSDAATISNNVSSANGGSGIAVSGPNAVIISNLLGVAPDGVSARGNGGDGIRLYSGGTDAVIGQPGAGNVIGANAFVGIELDGAATSAWIQGNWIGTDVSGTVDLGHRESGILFQLSTLTTFVGMDPTAAPDPAAANVIRFNGGTGPSYAGINVRDSVTGNVSIRGNSISLNDGLGIDLGEGNAVSANDVNDADAGANGTMNFPVITSVTESGPGTLLVAFDHDSGTGTFRYDAFSNPAGPDPSGHGEGETYLGSSVEGKSITGAESFTMTVAGTPGDVITMTASQVNVAGWPSSEFSTWAVAAPTTVTVNSTASTDDANPGDGICFTGDMNSEGAQECTLEAAVTEANAGATVNTIEFSIPVSDPGHSAGVWRIASDGPAAITTPLTIDGTTQSGAVANTAASPNAIISRPAIVLDGSAFTGDQIVFDSGADGSILRGLSIVGADDSGGSTAVRVDHADDVQIVGNHIGVEPDGLTSTPNSQGIAIRLTAADSIIGGTTPADRNLFATNGTDVLVGDDTQRTLVLGNTFGYDTNGAALSTFATDAAVDVYGSATARIGGLTTSEQNRMAGSAGGVLVRDTATATVLGNSAIGLNRPAIDLGADDGTSNDLLDIDSGPNDVLNHPEVTAASNSAATTTVDFDLDVPAGSYRIEFFENPSQSHPITFPTMERLVSSLTIVHPGSGSTGFTHTFAGSSGDIITLTGTEDLGGGTFGATSEPSPSAAVVGTEASVNSTGDAPDSNTGDGICGTGSLNSEGDSECTLRAALEEAAASPLLDTIVFDIPTSDTGYSAADSWWTIDPATSLPPVATALLIDGRTQPGAVTNTVTAPSNQNGRPAIRLDGSALSAADGFELGAGSDGSEVRGLSIVGFTGGSATAIEIHDTSNVTIVGNHIGIQPDGQSVVANNEGIAVYRATNVTIGGIAPEDRNLITGNTFHGVIVTENSPGFEMLGNDIGLDSTGTTVVTGGDTFVAATNATGTIGGDTQAAANRISGPRGIELFNTSRFTVLGNQLRSSAAPALDLLGDGATANDPTDPDSGPNDLLNRPVLTNAIESGGTATVDFELDVPAGDYRIEAFVNPSGTNPLPFPQAEQFASATTVSHPGGGVQTFTITPSVTGGDVLTLTVTEDLGGGSYGVTSEISGGAAVLTDSLTVNSSGDSTDALPGDGQCDTGGTNSEGQPECTLRSALEESNATSIQTTIGFAIPTTDGGHDAGNGWWSIAVPSDLPDVSSPVTIDGTTAGATTNTAAAPSRLNSRLTIELDGTGGSATDGLEFVAGADGSSLRGVSIVGFDNAAASAIQVTGTDGVSILGNHVGMRPDGTTPLPNAEGVVITGSSSGANIGGTLVGDRNLIAGNADGGAIVNDNSSATVEGNVFGVDNSGATVAGVDRHVRVDAGSSALIGGTTAESANLIVGATTSGVEVSATGDAAIIGNSIHANGGLGIDLGGDGVTANDVGDADAGPNDLRNHPVLQTAEVTGASIEVTFDIDLPAGDHRIEFFTNPAGADPSGHGEGQTLVHTAVITSTGAPMTALTVLFPGAPSDIISATATATAGPVLSGTSEFSNAIDANGAPVITPPGDRTDAENDVISLAMVATDPDADSLTWSATGLPTGVSMSAAGLLSGTISFDAAGPWSPTIRATDPVGSFDEASFSWSITNTNRAPVVTDPGPQSSSEGAPISLALTGTDPDGDTISWGASGLPDGLTINASTGEITGTLTYVSSGTSLVTITASDAGANTMIGFSWTVANTNRNPIVTDPGTQTNAEGNTVNFTIGGSDPDGQALSWTATGLPPGLSINAATGEITGTLTFTSAGTWAVGATATDPEGADDQTSFTWQVNNTNLGVTVNDPGDQINAENDAVSLFINGSDGDNDPLTWTASGLPDGLTINTTTGEISGTLSFTAAGAPTVTVTATDPGGANDSTSFTWTVSNTNRAANVTNPGTLTNAESDVIAVTIAGSDPDGDPLVWSATGLPDGLTIDAATGEISGVIGFDAAGTFASRVNAFDGTNSSAVQFDWTVTNTNRSPIVGAQPDHFAAENDSLTITNSASDPDGQPTSWTATGLPAGLAIEATTGEITGTLGFDTAGTSTVTVTATDPEGATGTASFDVIVTNTNRAPVLTVLPNQTNAEGNDVNLSVTAIDPDGDPLTWSASGLPSGLSIDPANGLISGTLPFTASGVWTPAIDIADPSGATDGQTLDWIVTNTNLGVLVNSPGDQTSLEFDLISLFVNGSDGDNEPLVWAATGLPDGLSMDAATGEIAGTLTATSAGTTTVVVTATEPSGLSDAASFAWTVQNVNRAPTLAGPGAQSTVAGTTVNLSVTASDADGDPLAFTATGLPPGITINSATGAIGGRPTTAGTSTVTVAATDGLDTASVSFTWQITAAPVPATTTTTIPPTTTAPTTTTAAPTTTQAPVASTTTTTTTAVPDDPPGGIAFNAFGARDDTVVIRGNTITPLFVLENDILNGPVRIVSIDQPSAGEVRVLDDGSLGFIPPPGYAGELSFSYTIENRDGQVSSAVVRLVLAVALDPAVGTAAADEIADDTAGAVTRIVDSLGALVGDVLSIRLSRLEGSVVGFGLIVFLVLRTIALRRRETLVLVNGVARDEPLAAVGTDGVPIGIRHDAKLWVRGRRGRTGTDGREIRVETPHGDAWVEAETITDSGY